MVATQQLDHRRAAHPRFGGEYEFQEDKTSPPSRAYLKLWELFTRLGHWPRSGERVLDLGASPGGWTFVLANQLGANVVAGTILIIVPRLRL